MCCSFLRIKGEYPAAAVSQEILVGLPVLRKQEQRRGGPGNDVVLEGQDSQQRAPRVDACPSLGTCGRRRRRCRPLLRSGGTGGGEGKRGGTFHCLLARSHGVFDYYVLTFSTWTNAAIPGLINENEIGGGSSNIKQEKSFADSMMNTPESSGLSPKRDLCTYFASLTFGSFLPPPTPWRPPSSRTPLPSRTPTATVPPVGGGGR